MPESALVFSQRGEDCRHVGMKVEAVTLRFVTDRIRSSGYHDVVIEVL